MSLRNRFKNWNPYQKPLLDQPPVTDVPAKERAQVAQLIANGKSEVAVDIAKAVHKRLGIAASEELLVVAYAARIISLAERKLDKEANALLEQVQSRHPSSRERLRETAAILKARGGDPDALLELLADPALMVERRAVVEVQIRREAGDPGRIARCEALPAEHPLRVAARAVERALEAVTSGPVAAESLTLPEISRTSPLAPWKMAVRAIHAFYAGEDARCEQYLAAMDPDAAAARVVPAIRAMLGQKVKMTPDVAALVGQADGGGVVLRGALKALDGALETDNHKLIVQQIGNAAAVCSRVSPGLMEGLKQRISIRTMLVGVQADRVASAMGGPSLKNAAFWRLLARGHEEHRQGSIDVPLACGAWDEFRRHAVHEKWFAAGGPEVAALYLHMVDLWRRIPEEEIEFVARSFAAKFQGQREYYNGQPAEIRNLMPASGREDLYYLSPDALLERACTADPCAGNYELWLKWAGEDRRRGDKVARHWAAALPRDSAPVLYLMQSAEETNALKKAFKLMEQAERLDGLNPEVRKARLRLLISLATRHLQQQKTHLAEPELRQLEKLPQARSGDRPALVAALRWACCRLRVDKAGAEILRGTVVRLLGGETAANFLLQTVAASCNLRGLAPEFRFAPPLAGALGRVCALGEDTGLAVKIPRALSGRLLKEVSGKAPAADVAGLVAVGEAALRGYDDELAYAVSRAGLKLTQERWAEFLFMRARALPDWEEKRQARCAAAASELARRQRNLDLLRRIGEWREEGMVWFDRDDTDVAMTTKQIDDLVKRENAEAAYPTTGPGDLDNEEDLCGCPACRARRGELPPELEQVMGDMPPELARMLEELGPEEALRAIEEIIGGGPGKRRRRRRPVFGDDEVPF